MCGFFTFFILKGIKFKESILFVEKNVSFNKKKTESKIENFTHSFREINLELQLV